MAGAESRKTHSTDQVGAQQYKAISDYLSPDRVFAPNDDQAAIHMMMYLCDAFICVSHLVGICCCQPSQRLTFYYAEEFTCGARSARLCVIANTALAGHAVMHMQVAEG